MSDAVATQLERPTSPGGDSDDVGRSLLDELMTSRQVAALLQMRLSTVESYARRGLLPSVKVGRHRFVRSQVERALAALVEDGYQPRDRAPRALCMLTFGTSGLTLERTRRRRVVCAANAGGRKA